MSKYTIDTLHEAYVKFRGNPENDDITDGMWCGQEGLAVPELSRMKSIFQDLNIEVLKERRNNYIDLLSQVDKGLFDKAIKGDTKAADLVYRRFEGWSPKQAEQGPQGATTKTFAELVAGED